MPITVSSINLWGEVHERCVRAEAAGVDMCKIKPDIVFIQEAMNIDQVESFMRGLGRCGVYSLIESHVVSRPDVIWRCWVPTLATFLVISVFLLFVACKKKSLYFLVSLLLIILIVLSACLSPPIVCRIGNSFLGFDNPIPLAIAIREPITVATVYGFRGFEKKMYRTPPTDQSSLWNWIVWWFVESALYPGFLQVELDTPDHQKVSCYNVHLTPGRLNPVHAQQADELLQHLTGNAIDSRSVVIIAGDFNDTSSETLAGPALKMNGFMVQCNGPTWTRTNPLTYLGAFGNTEPDGDIDQIWTRGAEILQTGVLVPTDDSYWSDHFAPWVILTSTKGQSDSNECVQSSKTKHLDLLDIPEVCV